MPAVTADTLTLPRLTAAPRPAAGPSRPSPRRPSGSRARASRSAARSPASPPRGPRPVHPHGPDGRGRVRPGRAQGHAVAPAPRLRDVHVPDRRPVHPPGLARRRRHDRRRRHPVHDGRRRHPAHRDAPRSTSWSPAACSTACSCGSTCRARRSASPRSTRTFRARLDHGRQRRRRRAGARPRRRGRRPRRARASRTRRWRSRTSPSRRAPRSTSRGAADFNALAYVLSGYGTVGAERRPIRTGQLAVLGEGDTVVLQADAAQESRSPSLEVFLIGGVPLREPVVAYGPFVMSTKAELDRGVRRLPGRPPRHRPGGRHPAAPRLVVPGHEVGVGRGCLK